MLNFDELHLRGIKCFHLFGISEGKNQGAKRNSIKNFSVGKISLYLLGHLQANNQRSEKLLSLIRNFKGGEIQPPAKISSNNFSSQVVADVKADFMRYLKIFSVHLLKVLASCVLAGF